MANESSELRKLQRRYYAGAALVAPIAPFVYLQSRIVRWKVGVLPDAAGARTGRIGDGDDAAKLLVIGESTVAGLGARDHEKALAGQFAHFLSQEIGRGVEWSVVGRSGVTARRTIDELVPQIPDKTFDHILVGLGGNDVMTLSSPTKWRRDMLELLGILRERNPDAAIFMSNCPMIIYSPVLPPPIKQILWQLSQMHNRNSIEFSRQLDRVFYFPQPVEVEVEGFFADGLHPSEQGYRDWARAMVRYFADNHEW